MPPGILSVFLFERFSGIDPVLQQLLQTFIENPLRNSLLVPSRKFTGNSCRSSIMIFPRVSSGVPMGVQSGIPLLVFRKLYKGLIPEFLQHFLTLAPFLMHMAGNA